MGADVAASEPQSLDSEQSLEASVQDAASTGVAAAPTCSRAPSTEQAEAAGATDELLADASKACKNVFPWIGKALHVALGDESAAEALAMCVEVILTDECTDWSDAVSQAASMLLEEGVPND